MKPMLAKQYKQYKHLVSWPCAIQPKLDGIRMMFQNGTMQSRNARTPEIKTWPSHRLRHLRDSLARCPPDILLDGELYIHQSSRQTINGIAGVNNNEDDERTLKLEYWIFDCVNAKDLNAPFTERHGLLSYLFEPSSFTRIVQTELPMNEAEGDTLYSSFKQRHFEGAIYRQLDESYGFVENCTNKENRWTTMLKRKDHLDGEFEIIGVVEGEGKYTGMVGALELQFMDGGIVTFNAGSGLTDDQRERYWTNPPIGCIVTIRYDILSDQGIPIQPRIEEVYE